MRRLLGLLAFTAVALTASGQGNGSLKNIPVPLPANLAQYVRDQNTLVVLGKALFWDMQVGSDARMACASCHFHAGADHRSQNQLSNPGKPFLANYQLTSSDFPFHQLANVNSNSSTVIRDSGQRAASAGTFRRDFMDVITGAALENGADVADTSGFAIGGVNVRQSGTRNTPTVINAVYNYRNFWDGRASNVFTGLTPFGTSDTRANLLSNASGSMVAEVIALQNSSLASQAVGPPLNALELSYTGRSWAKLGKKVLALQPLAAQKIATSDSVLGPRANGSGKGFSATTTYLDLVKAAFQPSYWNSTQLVDVNGKVLTGVTASGSSAQFTQAEYNFAIFFGIAIQAYEATLISDNTPFDLFASGQTSALNAQEQAGMREFQRGARCDLCHTGPEFTQASVGAVVRNGTVTGPVDTGFFRTGVRPVADDVGLGTVDDFGQTLSAAVATGAAPTLVVSGTFKTPGLRNIEFTGPYFHDGGQATLEQLVQFYSRGGDFPDNTNRGLKLDVLNLNANEIASIVAFLKALTDDRVRYERAPFDHPELCVPIKQATTSSGALQVQSVFPGFNLSAADMWAGLPAVGQAGNPVPLQTFEELLNGIGNDGSRAHTLTDACAVTEVSAPISVAGASNAASGEKLIAPGMALSLYGTLLGDSVAAAANVPLPASLSHFTATVNGVNAPLYYASPTQVNLQVPYETPTGTATLVISNATQSATYSLTVAAVAPGVFTFADGRLTPNPSAARGETISLYLSGAGQVSPSIATGAAPAASTPVSQLPKPTLPVTVTIGGVPCSLQFVGIPYGLVGVTQVNFTVPASASLGIQTVTVTVGSATSSTAKLTVTR